ncbi:MAG: EVE domain-containing protein [Chromatiales bacterium]
MNYWLLKSEPTTFSVDNLAASPNQTTAWDGVRSFQARNMLRDEIKPGDLAFFYHSSCEVPGITGIVEVVSKGYVDATQFDPKDYHYDLASKRDDPRWYCVDVRLKRKLKRTITLEELRAHKRLSGLKLLQRGNRLSVLPVTQAEWKFIVGLE